MIEDPELTRRILEYFASDEVKFPANKRVEELAEAFPEVDFSRLKYHVRCAGENGLLIVNIREQSTFSSVHVIFGFISGLTAKGGDYVRGSRSKFWNEAKKKIINKGLEVTTSNLAETMFKLISTSLGG